MIRALFVSLLYVGAATATIAEEGGVLVLTDDNFKDAIASGDMLVEFYAPWCGHCKTLEPEYKKAAASLAGESARLAKVDATVNTAVAEEFGIKGFPTLKYFKGGRATEYGGGRTASEIVSWVKKQSGPPARTITTADELLGLQEVNDVVVVGYFADVSSNAAKSFLKVASGDESNVYAITSSEDIKQSLNLQGDTVVVLTNFDDKRNDLSVSTFDIDAVEKFVSASSTPLIQTFSQESSKKIFSSKIQRHALFFTNTKASYHETVVDAFRTVAKQFAGELLVVNVPSSESRVIEYFGITESDLPTLVAVDMTGKAMKKFPYGGDVSSPNGVATFVQAFLKDELKPTLKSETPAPEDTAGPVKVLKGTSFNDIVINNSKNVLVEFYAPWCGHCKKLAPTWDELGAKYANDDNVVIAKMDSTANEVDVEGLAVSGFPTIFFFPGQNKRPVKYEGGRELDDFVSYLDEHATPAVKHSEL